MNDKLKALGVFLGTFLAAGVVVASTASAGEVTGSEPEAIVSSEGPATNTLKYPTGEGFQELACQSTKFTVGNKDKTSVPGKHPPLEFPALKLTFSLHVSNCIALVNESQVGFATVTMNGCAYDLTIGEETEAGAFSATGDLNCSTGTEVVAHVYLDESHSMSICTFTFGEEGNQERQGATLENLEGGDLTLDGPVEGLHATRSGIFCGGASTTGAASLDIHAKLSGENEAEEPVELHIE
jgi:hypothetical protein